MIEQGTFKDPCESVFVILGEQQELAVYPNLRAELLKRTIGDANEPRPGFSAEAVFAEIDAMLSRPFPPAAQWDASVTRPLEGEAGFIDT